MRFYSVLFLIVFFHAQLNAQVSDQSNPLSDTIFLDNNSKDISVFMAGKFKVLEDKQYDITIEKILNNSNIFSFESPEFPSHLNNTASDFWLKFTIINNGDSARPLVLDYQYSAIHHISLYEKPQIDADCRLIGIGGSKLAFSKRTFPARDFIFRFNQKAHSTSTYFLFLSFRNQSLSLPLFLYDPNSYDVKENKTLLLFGIANGILFIISLISFLMYVFYKERVYLFYWIYLLSSTFWQLSNSGIAYQYIWSDYVVLESISAAFFSATYLIFFLLFVVEFFKFKQIYPVFYIILMIDAAIVCFLLLFMVCFAAQIHDKEFGAFWLIYYICCLLSVIVIGIVIWLIYQREKSMLVLIFSFVYSIIAFLVFIIALKELVPIPVNTFTENIGYYGIIGEVLIVSFSLGYKINALIKEREKFLIEKNELQHTLLNAEIQAGENERKKIAEDLHDDLGMLLTSTKLAINRHEPDTNILSMLDRSIEKVQNITRELHPSVIQQFGLIPALDEILKTIALSIPGNLVYKFDENLNVKDKDQQVNIFRIINELVNNAIKHSQAEKILLLVLAHKEKGIEIVIKDNGIGFEPKQPKIGLGLRSIESRVNAMKGQLTVQSEINIGTKISIYIPL